MTKRKCLCCGKGMPYKHGVIYCSKQCSDKMYNHPSNGPVMPPLKKENIADEGCVNLVKAIVSHAAHDVTHSKPGTRVRVEAEKFFESEHFNALTGLDGQAILRDLCKKNEKPDTRGKKTTRKVRCIETGVVYASIAAAGRARNCNPHSIQDVCAKRRNHVRGLHWEYVEEEAK